MKRVASLGSPCVPDTSKRGRYDTESLFDPHDLRSTPSEALPASNAELLKPRSSSQTVYSDGSMLPPPLLHSSNRGSRTANVALLDSSPSSQELPAQSSSSHGPRSTNRDEAVLHQAPQASATRNDFFRESHGFTVGSMTNNSVGRDQVSIHYHQVKQARVVDRDGLRREIREWLKAPKFTAIHSAALEQRADETGVWFLESQEFQDYMQEDGSVLWCTGKPGSGKTILSSIAIEHLQESSPAHANVAVIYAYLRYSEKHALRDVAVALLDQLLVSDAAVAMIEPCYRRMKEDGVEYTPKQIFCVIRDIVGCLSKVYAVLDGLDEASNDVKDGLLKALCPMRINLLIFSRPLGLFTHHLPHAVQVSIQARTEDIARFILEKFESSSALKALLNENKDLALELSERIKKQADGMFLLARLQLESIMRRSINAVTLFKLLKELPSGIEEMYRSTLQRINDQPHELVSISHRLFVWLLHAKDSEDKQRLSVHDVQRFLCVSVEDRTFDKRAITPVDLILSACHGLVTLQESSADEEEQGFQFIHYSTQEFLKSEKLSHVPKPHSFMAATLVTYIHQFFPDPEESFWPYWDRYDGADLLHYAVGSWGYHAGLCEEGREHVHPTVLWSLSQHPNYPIGTDTMIPSLSAAARYNLIGIIKTKSLPYPFILWPNECPYHQSVECSHFESFMAILSTYGKQNPPRWTWVFDKAVCSRACITFLRQLFAPIDSPPTEAIRPELSDNVRQGGVTVLHEACAAGNHEVVRLFLELGSDVHIRDFRGRTAFLSAADSRHVSPELLKLLLAHDQSLIHHRDVGGRTALMLAVWSDPQDLASVQFLLKVTPTRLLNIRDAKGSSALVHAVQGQPSEGRTKIVRLLLNCPSLDARASDCMGRSVLESSCSKGAYICGNSSLAGQRHFFALLYTLLDIEGGWNAYYVRKAVVTAVGSLSDMLAYRLLLEDWVVHSFVWSLDDLDTIVLLAQAFTRTWRPPPHYETRRCGVAVSIVLYRLGLLESVLPPGPVTTWNHKQLGKVLCGNVSCLSHGRSRPLGYRTYDVYDLPGGFANRRSYTTAELEQRIKKTPPSST